MYLICIKLKLFIAYDLLIIKINKNIMILFNNVDKHEPKYLNNKINGSESLINSFSFFSIHP